MTIDKAYFETILRRADFHASGLDWTTPIDIPTVTIPKADHDNLLGMAQEYSMLPSPDFQLIICQWHIETSWHTGL